MRNNVPKLPDKVMCCTRPISLYVPPSDGENYGKVFMQVEYAAAVVSENSTINSDLMVERGAIKIEKLQNQKFRLIEFKLPLQIEKI